MDCKPDKLENLGLLLQDAVRHVAVYKVTFG